MAGNVCFSLFNIVLHPGIFDVACFLIMMTSTFLQPSEAKVIYIINPLYNKYSETFVNGLWLDTVNDDLYSCRDYSVDRYDGTSHSVVAGTAGNTGSTPTSGSSATANRLYRPVALTGDGNGNMFIAVFSDFLVCKTDTNGIISYVAGTGNYGASFMDGDGGRATSANLPNVAGMAIDSGGNIYFFD